MPNYRIVIEDTRTELRSKVFTTPNLGDAIRRAEDEDWQDPSWEFYDENTNCEIRVDLCEREPTLADLAGSAIEEVEKMAELDRDLTDIIREDEENNG